MQRFLAETKAKVVDKSAHGELYRLESTDPVVAVHVKCPSTNREYWLRVPPTITTAHEARAWGFRRTVDTFSAFAMSQSRVDLAAS